ncbi:hypothetical protein TNCV_3828641 [Trichonephila clavipes]|nr:hypothetical protein TNCV_3828641 [Trichonephila clavipes]
MVRFWVLVLDLVKTLSISTGILFCVFVQHRRQSYLYTLYRNLTDDFVNRNLECVSILLSSIWDSDFHGFGNLGLKRGRDFRGGDPMAVQEALAMERSLIEDGSEL